MIQKSTDSLAQQEGEYPQLLPERIQEITVALQALVDDEAAELEKSSLTLRTTLPLLHEADLSDLLETLHPNLRTQALTFIEEHRLAMIINDMNEATAIAVLGEIADDKLAQALAVSPELEEVEGVLRSLPPKRRADILQRAGLASNLSLLRSLSFAPDTVGEMMDFFQVTVSPEMNLSAVTAMIRKRGKLPSHCDKLFVTANLRLVGVLPLKTIILQDQDKQVADVMVSERLHTLTPTVSLEVAADLFERYDLVSVPIVNDNNDVIGRLTIDEVVYHLRDEQHADLLTSTGFQDEEDLYAPIKQRLRNRGFWIFINLIAAFLVSRVIGNFEGTILQIVALASLMPIIASMAGNTGMQTATLVIRALALNQISLQNWHLLLGRELSLGVVNGVLWGTLVGLFGFLFYQQWLLSVVLTISMLVVFVLAAIAGFVVPVLVQALKGDPALGTSVIVTTLTDCLGFLTFLGLATTLLV